MSNPLFDALQNTFSGDQPLQENTEKFPGLIAYSKRWLMDGGVDDKRLQVALERMQHRVEGAVMATEKDIENTDEHSIIRDPMERSAEAYAAAFDAIGQLLESIEPKDPANFRAGLELFEEAADVLKEATEQIDDWLSSDEPKCLRCGSAGSSEVCRDCRIQRIIPHPESITESTFKTAQLGPEYVTIFQRYVKILSGEACLSSLWSTFNPLEKRLGDLDMVYRDLVNDEDGAEAAEFLLAIVNDTREGLEQMRETARTKRMSHLVRGWNHVFESAIHLQSLLTVIMNNFTFDDE